MLASMINVLCFRVRRFSFFKHILFALRFASAMMLVFSTGNERTSGTIIIILCQQMVAKHIIWLTKITITIAY